PAPLCAKIRSILRAARSAAKRGYTPDVEGERDRTAWSWRQHDRAECTCPSVLTAAEIGMRSPGRALTLGMTAGSSPERVAAAPWPAGTIHHGVTTMTLCASAPSCSML